MTTPPHMYGEAAPPTLGDRARHAARWLGVMRLASKVLMIGIALLLARLLVPEDYGLYAMVVVLIQFAFYLEGFRVEEAVVQRRVTEPHVLKSAHYFILLASFGFTLLFLASIPVMAWFFGESRIVLPMAALSSVFLIRGSVSMHRALLRREIDFKTISIIRFGRIFPSAAVAIVLAVYGFGVWSLVAYMILQEVVEAVALHVVVRWRPEGSFSWPVVRELLSFGGASTANEIATYVQFHFPTYLVGRVLGASLLGLFKFSFIIIMIVPQYLQQVIAQVLFPVLARAQNDPALLQRAYLQSLYACVVVSTPFAVLLLMLAGPLVRTFLGENWYDIIPFLQILALAGIPMAIQPLFNAAFHSLGRPMVDFRLNLYLAAALVAVLFWSIRYGLEGVSYAFLILFPLYAIVGQARLNQMIGLKWRDLLMMMFPVVAATALLAGVTAAALFAVGATVPTVRLVVPGMAGLAVYAAFLYFLGGADAQQFVRNVLPLRMAPAARPDA